MKPNQGRNGLALRSGKVATTRFPTITNRATKYSSFSRTVPIPHEPASTWGQFLGSVNRNAPVGPESALVLSQGSLYGPVLALIILDALRGACRRLGRRSPNVGS